MCNSVGCAIVISRDRRHIFFICFAVTHREFSDVSTEAFKSAIILSISSSSSGIVARGNKAAESFFKRDIFFVVRFTTEAPSKELMDTAGDKDTIEGVLIDESELPIGELGTDAAGE
jgi:hypothetical protein